MRFTVRGSLVLILISLLVAAPPILADELRDAKKQYRALIGDGQYEDALAAARRALDIAEAKKGVGSSGAVKVMSDIANIYSHLERHEEARAEIARALAAVEASRGPDSPRLVPFLLRTGVIEMRAGATDAAIPAFERALGIRERKHGPEHELLVLSLVNLSDAYFAAGRAEDAANAIERAVAIQEKTGKFGVKEAERILTKFAAYQYNRGKFEDARRLHEGLLRLIERNQPAGSNAAAGFAGWIGFMYDQFPLEGDERLELVRFPSRESPILFDIPPFNDSPVNAVWRVAVNGTWGHTFYWKGNTRAEVELGQGKNQAVVSVKSRITPAEAIDSARTLARDQVKWGEAGEAENPVGTMDYQRFEHLGEKCFAFARAFAPSRVQIGQTKLLSGFFCRYGGAPLSGQDIASIVSRLGVRNYAEPEPR